MAGANCVLWQAKLCIATTTHDSQSSTIVTCRRPNCVDLLPRPDVVISQSSVSATTEQSQHLESYALVCNLSEITCFQGMSNNMLHNYYIIVLVCLNTF